MNLDQTSTSFLSCAVPLSNIERINKLLFQKNLNQDAISNT
jgi:hypothetical protein